MSQQSALAELLIDEDEFKESLLTDVLAPYVRIGSNSGAFVPTEEFESLKSMQKIAVVLLYRKAAFELGQTNEEGATPMEITTVSGINHSTVKTAVRELDDLDLVDNGGGEYSIPMYNHESIRELIQEDTDER